MNLNFIGVKILKTKERSYYNSLTQLAQDSMVVYLGKFYVMFGRREVVTQNQFIIGPVHKKICFVLMMELSL